MLANADSIRIPLADGVVQCVVTSPPYWGLRAYSGEQQRVWPDGWRGGLGLEPTPELFIEHMVQVFREVRRVMRDDGVAWVNMGDSFNDKQLVMMPHRLALALQSDGWWVRSDVVWAKPNPMPESLRGWRWEQCRVKTQNSKHATDHNIKGGHKKMLEDASVHQGMSPEFLAQWQPCTGCPKCEATDGLVLRRSSWRPTSSHEYVFMLAKSSTYFSDGEAVRETTEQDWGSRNRKNGKYHNAGTGLRPHTGLERSTSGRNLRSVWNIATQPFKGAHYATFPEKLARTCILASTSRHACAKCGMAWSRKLEKPVAPYKDTRAHGRHVPTGNKKISGAQLQKWLDANPAKTLGYMPSCQCDADTKPCVVLDPFCGSGTVGQVCRELPYQRDFVGLDLSFDYLRDQALIRSEQLTPASKLAELPMFT